MKIRSYLSVLAVSALACFVSCNMDRRSETMEKFSWIEGRWVANKKLGKLEETWKWEAGKMTGAGSAKLDGDVYSRDMELAEMSGNVIYFMSNPMKNGERTPYQWHPSGEDSFVFLNEKEHYPSRIVYQRVSRDSTAVKLSGNTGQGYFSDSFMMVRQP